MDPKQLSNQLKKPTGAAGIEVAEALNESNWGLYDLAFETMTFEAGNDILEIGFGNGKHFSEYFRAEPDLRLTGVDFSTDMCAEAKSRNAELIKEGKLSIHCSETSSLPFRDQSFDLAVALNVIYFLDPPEIHLKEIQRVLKPGGLFLIGYRPRHSVEHLEFTKQNFILYEADELGHLLEKNGFELVREETRSYKKHSVDETEFTVKDCCLLAKSIHRS